MAETEDNKMTPALLEKLIVKREKLIVKYNKLNTRISKLGGNKHLHEIMPPIHCDTSGVENHVAIQSIIETLTKFRKRSDDLIKLELEECDNHLKLDVLLREGDKS